MSKEEVKMVVLKEGEGNGVSGYELSEWRIQICSCFNTSTLHGELNESKD